MKVLVYGAESFLGMGVIYRFYKDGSKVVGVYDNKHPSQASKVPHSKYVLAENDRIEDIIEGENPNVFVYAKYESVTDQAEAQRKIGEVKHLADACANANIMRFIYISSIDVYGSQKNEDAPIYPQNINARTNALCEQAILISRNEKRFKNVILRCADIYGARKKLKEGDVVFECIDALWKDKPLQVDKSCSIIHTADVTDAMSRAIGDGVDGIYNITPKKNCTVGELANAFAKELGKPEIYEPGKAQEVVPHQKAVADFGFVCRDNFQRIVDESLESYRTPQYEKKDKKKFKLHNSGIVRTVESIIVFLLLSFITVYYGTPAGVFSINVFILYIIVMSTFFGINQGVFAALLVSVFDVWFTTRQGYSLTSALYDASVLAEVVQNLLVAICIGYVVDKKDFVIGEKSAQIKAKEQEIDYLEQLKRDLVLIKNEQEEKVLKYENGFGRIYSAISTLATLAPKEVFFNSLLVIKDLVDENDISLYVVQSEYGYMRRLVYIGREPDKFPTTYRIKDNDELFEIVRDRKFYSNRYLSENMPSVIVPIVADDKVFALVMIDHMAFDRLTLYYMNTIEVVGKLLSDTYSKAMAYEEVARSSYYEKDSCIICQKNFEDIVEAARHAKDSSGLIYTMLCIDREYEWQNPEIGSVVRRLIRDNDEIGRLAQGNIGVLLYSTCADDSKFVIERFEHNGIPVRILDI